MRICAKVGLMQESELMTVVEAAGYLGVHSMTLHKWTREGKFKVTRLGRKNYLDPAEVKAFKAEAETRQIKKATELLTIPKAASYLGVHFATLYRWIKARKLHPVKIGWQIYLTIDDVETLKASLDAQLEKPLATPKKRLIFDYSASLIVKLGL